MIKKWWGLCALVVAAACGSSSGPPAPFAPAIELDPFGGGRWVAPPVLDQLEEVSNDGVGYTGDVDRYEITTPEPGRLQVSLSWDHDADFDVVITADPEGSQRLATGVATGFDPEYIGLPVAGGQTLYVFVAGWQGDPGEYTLDTILLPFDAPTFDIDPDFAIDSLTPANGPLAVRFNVELDPDQDLNGRVFMVSDGHVAEGVWCVDGFDAVFYPALPQVPLDEGGIHVGVEYTVQFPRAASGPRAVTGEYLTELVGGTVFIDFPLDPDPAEPPRVIDVTPPPGEPWDGRNITVRFSEPLDLDTLTPALFEVVDDQIGALVPFSFTITQVRDCEGSEYSIQIHVQELTPRGIPVRLVLPATVLGISGDNVSQNALTGPAPQPGGEGFAVDFVRP